MPASATAARRRVTPWKIAAGLTAAGCLLFATGIGVLVATGTAYVRPTVDLSGADADAAYAACQAFARKELKAPGPVTFPPLRDWNVRRYMNGRLRVRARAEAVHGAGRGVDLRIACRLRPLPDGRFDLEGLSISTD